MEVDVSSPTPSIDLIHDPDFLRLVHLSSRRVLTWKEFASQPMPRNMSPLDTYRELSNLNMKTGILLPLIGPEGRPGWYQTTMQMNEDLATIYRMTAKGSLIHTALKDTAGQQIIMKMRIADISAAARLDEIGVPDADIEDVVRLLRKPATDSEQLIYNVLNVERHLADFGDRPITFAMLEEMNEAILEGVDVDRLPGSERRFGLMTQYAIRPDDIEDGLAKYLAYANDEVGDRFDIPVLHGSMLTEGLGALSLFEHTSFQLGRLMTKLYFIKHDMPCLASLPLYKARLDWEENRTPDSSRIEDGSGAPADDSSDAFFSHRDIFTREEFNELSSYIENQDCTMHQSTLLQLIVVELERSESLIRKLNEQDQEMRAFLKEDATINPRQRTILARALKKPDADFCIRYHQSNHGITYPTARADLLSLVDRGFLIMGKKGKAFVFRASPELPKLLGGR